MNCVITGISGFVGSHLAEYLLSKNFNVYGTFRKTDYLDNIAAIKNKLGLFEADILDKKKINEFISKITPTYVFHLAAQASVAVSIRQPQETKQVNVGGTRNVLEAVRQTGKNSKVLIIGSADEYGLVKSEDMPIKESHELNPQNPYAESKKEAELLAIEYYQKSSLKVILTRSFNHTGPRQSPSAVCADWSKQIAEIEKKKKAPIISVGNLNVKRDFTDVRDVVAAYLLLMEKGESGGIYNVCSATGYDLHFILETLLGLSNVSIEYKVDSAKFRETDTPVYIGDNSKISALGWKPTINIKDTLNDTLDYWRRQIK
ncbi:GDP-mannose 4,6-dehydratase [Candidatus Woesearchaeota archaeon]|nr:GDP-mannose 4,6-dehydratase [Candidatus Woesearchaeota archaeon]